MRSVFAGGVGAVVGVVGLWESVGRSSSSWEISIWFRSISAWLRTLRLPSFWFASLSSPRRFSVFARSHRSMIHVDRLRWRRAGGHRSPSAKVDATAEQFRARLSPTSPIEGAGLSGAAAAGGGDVSGGEAGFGGVGADAGGGRLELKAPVASA